MNREDWTPPHGIERPPHLTAILRDEERRNARLLREARMPHPPTRLEGHR